MLVFRLPVMALMLTFGIPGGFCTERYAVLLDEPELGVSSGCSVPGKLLPMAEDATLMMGENSRSTLLQ